MAADDLRPTVQTLLRACLMPCKNTAALEAAIDAAVYRLFGVEAGEIAVVEG